jgi:hypothetical protein
MKTVARFSLADIARATRAAKEQEAVEILPDGTIRVVIARMRVETRCGGRTRTRTLDPLIKR